MKKILVVCTLAVLTGCTTYTDTETYSVNGQEVTQEEYNQLKGTSNGR